MSEDISALLSQLYRSHFGKMVAVLMYHTGIKELAVSEDIVQEAFAIASKNWQKSVPDQPEAWLYKTIRNIAYNTLKKDSRKQVIEEDYIAQEVRQTSDQDILRVLFACLQPALPPKVQLVIVLRYVCGLRVKRIAALMACGEEGISKIIYRWRAQHTAENLLLDQNSAQPGEQKVRMALKVLYVMFTEGYQLGEDGNLADESLCEDALSLLQEIDKMGIEANGEVKVLHALLLYNLARARSRTNHLDELITWEEQDRTAWNKEMIAVANHYLLLSQRTSSRVSAFQLEAAIAFKHTSAKTYGETDWQGIAALYQRLAVASPSPFTKMGQAAALYFGGDEAAATAILNQLIANPFFQTYHLLHCFRARIYTDKGDTGNALASYKKALICPINAFERRFIAKKMHELTV
ncbi:sigma-70 family RNA polymerase sigma factor [Dyadobacter chenwenxiniae]|uniref:Sigma-70 family RNA polymerase sigma factor n=1 Tax=Dyadobacter chenwenxiniae TaxID=2906456 RepID=A0A9X1PU96_9BACT|nr:sigma-70 family RNA polymerase sigma factor [Dyadobacter chenwenxiniae]MCF0065226.1 sigma-70 family RNA polymerase sigma factor [Dyadobacter chenwenxiniae]UON84504.1 sigma-70 family RNA polymerase sigma factor [Dyadobacter chenwenxiniae]